MSTPVMPALLGELVPDGFEYGTNYLVEFDPSSLWYETSLTIAVQAILRGIKCEYHVLQHMPNETLQSMERLGLETQEPIAHERLRIIDQYTPSTKLGKGEDVPHSQSWKGRQVSDLTVWSENIRKEILAGVAQSDRRWLHIDDDFSVFLQLFKENELIDFYRNTLKPWTRARELLMFSSIVNGVASEAFCRRFESLCDGVIDFASREEEDEIRQYIRIRKVRGKSFDSHWRLLKLQDDGDVSFVVGQRREFKFKTAAAGKLFDYLADAFIEDFMRKNISPDKSGWRTLVEMSKGTGVSASVLYGQYAKSGQIFRELARRGLVETRMFPGERGRGGNVTRMRIAYGKEPIRTFVDERVRIQPAKLGS